MNDRETKRTLENLYLQAKFESENYRNNISMLIKGLGDSLGAAGAIVSDSTHSAKIKRIARLYTVRINKILED